jgi:multicomponent Na+:H+ antiporter subunit D
MTIDAVPPALILIAAGLALPWIRDAWRPVFVTAAPLLALVIVWTIGDGPHLTLGFLGYTLTPVEGGVLSRLFGTVFSVVAFAGMLYAYRTASTLELGSALVYAGGAIGVVFAGDLITVFVFWEIMAIASTLVIWAAPGNRAYHSGLRYLLMHLFGGVLLMAGVVLYVSTTGSVEFGRMTLDGPATWLILVGFLVNAGAPPFSAWVSDAYPEASSSGTVFLSAFTTKTAVYVLIRGFPATDLLVYVGLYMIFYGIIYALLENDMRRILAYSTVNQVGFMVAGVGLGSDLALNGAAALAVAHVIFKALLLMSAGSVLYMTGKRKCTDLGGLFQTMPLTCLCGIVGALSISAFPLTSGFVSKSMINQAAIDADLGIVWYLLIAASAGVFLHAGIKFPWFVFFQKDSGLRPPDPPMNMRAAMVFFSFLCILIGVAPGAFYTLLPYSVDYAPYTAAHIVTMLQLLAFSGLAFFLMLPQMKRTLTISLDFDWFYRKAGFDVGLAATEWLSRARLRGERGARLALERWAERVFQLHGPSGALARTWQIGSTVTCIIVLLSIYLLISYL